MTIYVPNLGELEMLKSILQMAALEVGLYKNVVSPDGGTTFLNIQEMPSGGGRGYARKSLANEIVENGLTANKWFLGSNSDGKAQAQYHNAALEWEFNANDVADGNTVYGQFGIIRVVPFDQGSSEIRVGDTITGATSGATAVVTGVVVISGAWTGDAAGYLFVKNQSATAFQDNENLQVGGGTKAVSNTGTLFGGDSHKQLMFLEAFTESKKIDTVGQKIKVTLKLTLSTA
ncbi:MAG: hypothetical protein AB1491_00095 [Thermodesulfobacteriota bacterium]